MALRDELLNPIAGDNPGGVELRYDPIFDKIKEARRESIIAPQGEWIEEPKVADWPLVIKLSKDALATKSKDLHVAAWLTEALLKREGFAGFAAGLDVLVGLVEQHWDHLYPEIDDGDAEMRAAPLDWIGLKLDTAVRMVPLDTAGNSLLRSREARTVPTETQAYEDETKAKARSDAIADGKATPEDLENAFKSTTKPWFKALVADIEASLEALERLDRISSDKFGKAAPGFAPLKEALTEVQRSAATALKEKLKIDPDPVDATAGASGGATADTLGAGGAAAGARGPLTPEPVSKDDAASRIVSAARYLRINDPFNPSAYLLLRGFRWGELRAGGSDLDPRLLDAPATHIRTNLRGMLLDARWPELLEAAETVMGTPQGRGWLDLQRYALTACDALGADYAAVGTAIRGALRTLLADLPQIVDMPLMDDTPTANAETRKWLRAEHLLPSGGDAQADGEEPLVAAIGNGDAPPRRSSDPISLANAHVRAGNTDKAIAMLLTEADREKTSRGRFLLQAHLARIMLDAGHIAVAQPILEQLSAAVEAHKLEAWESGDLVATPLMLQYRMLEQTNPDSDERQNLYLRICRLDPIRAISLKSQG